MKTEMINGGMNINKIVKQDNGLFSCLKKGDKLNGVISEITTDNVKVDISNKSYLLSKDKFEDDELKVGNKLQFEVVNITNDKTELRKINSGVSNEDLLKSVTDGLVDAKSVFESYDFVESDDEEVNNTDEDENTKSISRNIYEESIKKILNYENYDITKISTEEFMDMIIDFNTKILSGLKTDNNLVANLKDGKIGLPKEVLDEMNNIIDEVQSINCLSNDDAERIAIDFVKNDDYMSLNKIYETQFKVCKITNTNQDFDVNDFEDNIKMLLHNNDVDYTDQNVNAAKKLILNEIDVTKENIERFNEVKNTIENLDALDTLHKFTEVIALDEKIEDVCLESQEKIIEKTELITNSIDIVNEDDDKLQVILDSNKGNIKTVTLLDVEDAALLPKQNVSVNTNEVNELRMKLNEVRLMFTAKSAFAIYSKGIDVELAPIKETLSELIEISKQTEMINKGELLNSAYESLSDMKIRNFAIYKEPNEIKNSTLMQIAQICKERIDNSFGEINKDIKVVVTHDEVVKGYDNNMITSRYTLKGEYNIANRNMSELLNAKGIENNDLNLKCSIILSLTGKEVTEENINDIKSLEMKLDFIANNATPKVVKAFVEEGIDITKLNIDDLNQRVAQKVQELDLIENNANINNKEKMIDSLYDIIASENLSTEIKDAMLGVYKVINKITKYGNAGAGIVEHDDELNFTLREIFDATKVLERTRSGIAINQKIDDAFGTLEDLVENDNNAKKILDRSFARIREELNKDKELISGDDVKRLLEFAKGNEEILNKIYEDVEKATFEQIKLVKDFEDSKKAIKDAVLTSELISNSEEIKEEVNKLASNMKKGTTRIQDEKDHILALKELRDKDAQHILDEFVAQSENLEDTLDVTNRILDSNKNEMIRIESINKVLRLAYQEGEVSNSNMQIPILINDELTNINLIFDDNIKEDMETKMLVSVELPNIGMTKVDITFDEENESALLNFIVSDRDAINEISKSASEIIKVIEDAYRVSGISVNGKNINALRKETNNLYLRNKKIN